MSALKRYVKGLLDPSAFRLYHPRGSSGGGAAARGAGPAPRLHGLAGDAPGPSPPPASCPLQKEGEGQEAQEQEGGGRGPAGGQPPRVHTPGK